MLLTYKFRIKDSNSRCQLAKLAGEANCVWNYINTLSFRNIKEYSRFLSAYDIDKYTIGSAEYFNLHSTTFQELSKYYVNNRKTHKKRKLRWRSAKNGRTLGWIPFKSSAIKIDQKAGTIRYCKKIYKYYNSRNIPPGSKIKSGSFVQDSRDRWYICLAIEIEPEQHNHSEKEIGIDLGISTKITLSNGEKFNRDSITKKYETKLAKFQRANKKKQVRNIQAKIKNIRKDYNHKITSQIAKRFERIFIGDLKSLEILTDFNSINKAVYDSGLYQIKSFLKYKANKLGGSCDINSESWSTQTCSTCLELTSPTNLKIREWICCKCDSKHDRDKNAANNILRFGLAASKDAASNDKQISMEICRTGHCTPALESMGIPYF